MPLTYEEACNLINDLPRFAAKHTVEESKDFLKALGSPEKGMHIIHVAGTNGKGSVCVYMESILMHAGVRTGCFISPHLVDMCERIRIDGQNCTEEDFAGAASEVAGLAERMFWPSFFEFLFYMGMLIFKKRNVDVLILETGLGGRLDATNLPGEKELAVITSIGMDHCEQLGDTLPEIAAEKAGIMRKGVPAVYWEDTGYPEQAAVMETLHACAQKASSVEYALSPQAIGNVNVDNSAIDFDLCCGYDINICLSVPTRALYQVKNAALAVCALVIWDSGHKTRMLSEQDLVQGIGLAVWPGRMEEIFPRVFLDGAHNVPAVSELLRTAAEDGADRRLLVFGCMRDKQYAAEIDMILKSGLFDRIETVDIASSRAETAEKLAMIMRERVESIRCEDRDMADFPEIVCVDEPMGDSIARITDDCRRFAAEEDSYAYIAGSLYLVGEVRGLINDRF